MALLSTTARAGSSARWLCALLIFAGSMSASVNALVIEASDETAAQGATVSASVGVSELDGAVIAGFDLLLGFDASIVDFINVSFGDALDASDDGDPQFTVDEISDGLIEISGLSLFGTGFSNQDGNTPFTLFDVTFRAASVGTTPLTLAPNTLGSDVFFTDPLGATFDETSAAGSIEVTARPVVDAIEPGTLGLVLAGLLLLSLPRSLPRSSQSPALRRRP